MQERKQESRLADAEGQAATSMCNSVLERDHASGCRCDSSADRKLTKQRKKRA